MSELVTNDDRRVSSMLERHFTSGVVSMILVAILWVGTEILQLGKEQIKLNGSMELINTKMVGSMNLINTEMEHVRALLDTVTNDMYSRSNAEADKARYELLFKAQSIRLDNLEAINNREFKQNWQAVP